MTFGGGSLLLLQLLVLLVPLAALVFVLWLALRTVRAFELIARKYMPPGA